VERYPIQTRQSRLVLPGAPSERDDEVRDFLFVSMAIEASVDEQSVSIGVRDDDGNSATLVFEGVQYLRVQHDDSPPPLAWRREPVFNVAELNNNVYEFVMGLHSLEFTARSATVSWAGSSARGGRADG
jgi:hypothetical protein